MYYYCRLVICCCGMQLMSKQNSINPSELFAGVRLFSPLTLIGVRARLTPRGF